MRRKQQCPMNCGRATEDVAGGVSGELSKCVSELSDAINGVQDWDGTYVGDCLSNLESLVERIVEKEYREAAELAELAEPIDDEWLDGLTVGISRHDGQWCFSSIFRVAKTVRRNANFYLCIIGGIDVTELANRGQLLSLLKGLGIEVAK